MNRSGPAESAPEALGGEERASVLAAAANKPVRFVVLAEQQLRDQLAQARIPEPYIGAMVDIENKYAEGGFDVVSGDVELLAKRKPRALVDVLRSAIGRPS